MDVSFLHSTIAAAPGVVRATPALDEVWHAMALARRKLVAVLAADVAGYSRLMEADEERTYARLVRLRARIIAPTVARHHGRVVKSTGDGFFAAFDSARDAARCALALQKAVGKAAANDPPADRILFRMGLHVAEAIIEQDDIYGDGVNIAARLQTHAEPGGLVVSGTVIEQVGDQLPAQAVDIGDLFLRNLRRPVRAYALRGKGTSAALLTSSLFQDLPSIAVLPFRQGQNGEASYFVDGIIEGIIHVLAGIKELFVISHGSALAYAGMPVDSRQVGRELRVRYVLQGSVRRLCNRLRIQTELISAETGAVIRTDQFHGDMADLFALQDRISTQVVATIAPEVQEQELLRAARKHPDNMTAYDLLLQALHQFYRLDQESFARAGSLLQRSISLDPGYAPARSYAALWHLLRIAQGWSAAPDADRVEMARQSAAAVERDGQDALALAIRGNALSWMREHDAAMLVLDRAVTVGPSNAIAWTMGSFTCGFLGNGPEATRRGERGVLLSPLSPFAFFHQHALSQAHYITGNFDGAIAEGQRAAAQCGKLTSNLRTLAAALIAVGRLEEAREIALRQLAIEPGFRLTTFSARTPLPEAIRDSFVERLRAAGLPD